MTIARSEDINTLYNSVKKTSSFRTHFSTVKTEGINRTAKFCAKLFVMPKHAMVKLNISESFPYMYPPHVSVLFELH